MSAFGWQRLHTSKGMQLSEDCVLKSRLSHVWGSCCLRPGNTRKQRLQVISAGRQKNTQTPQESQRSLKQTLQGLEESFSQPLAAVEDVLDSNSPPEAGLPTAKRRKAARARHQLTYKVAAISASLGITSVAVAAIHYRFAWHIQNGGEVPLTEAVFTLILVGGGVVGMEMWARWAHKALWHDFAPGWALHKSHHVPRVGPFEANDVFAIVNAVPAIGLCAYGFLTPTILGGVCFGAGLGITLFGMMYMFVHDGLVHKRFPVGPLADVPYLKRVAAAHKLHHAERYEGVPWGLFLGPMELEAVGGGKDLDYMCQEMEKSKTREIAQKS